MKKFQLMILFFTLLFIHAIFANNETLAVTQLSQLLNSFSALKANFKETTVDLQQQVLMRGSGTVMLKRPDHFRWESKKPTHQIVMTDGKTLWIYDVDLKQATKQSIQHSPINPAKLLSGDVDVLLKEFDVRMIPHRRILVFQLTPKQSNQQFRSVAMVFVHDQLMEMQIENTLDQTTTFTFSHIKLNPELSPLLFDFSAPKDVDVLQ